MSEVQETGMRRKIEHIEKSQSSSSKTRKLYVLGVAFVAVLLIGTSFGMMFSATTPTIPTVIEPGSMVSTADFVVFVDAGNYYARNGQTGEIGYSSTNAYTLLNAVVHDSIGGSSIYIQGGTYDLGANTLLIDVPGTTLQGDSNQIGDYTNSAILTNISGDVDIVRENIKFRDLNIYGHVTLTSNAGVTKAAQYVTFESVTLMNGISWIGVSGATDMYVPFTTLIDKSIIGTLDGRPVFEIDNQGAGINHIFIRDTVIDQEYGDVLFLRGKVNDVHFVNCFFSIYGNDKTILNYTAPLSGTGHLYGFSFSDCFFEVGASDITVIKIPNSVYQWPFDLSFLGGWFQDPPANDDTILVDNQMQNGLTGFTQEKRILFDGVRIDFPHMRFNQIRSTGDPTMQVVNTVFSDCLFVPGVLFVQSGNARDIGSFYNNQNLNGAKWNYATPIAGGDTISLIGTSSTWSNATVYVVRDMPILLTVSGGTGVWVSVWNQTGASQWPWYSAHIPTMMYLPIGWKFAFGSYTAVPTVIIQGL